TPLARVIQRSLHFKLLNDVRIGQRHVGGLRHVVIRGADAFDQVVVVVFALSVDNDAHISTAELRGSVQFALRPRGKRQQLLVILRGQRQFANGFRPKRLARGRVGGLNRGDLRGNLHFFADRAWLQRDVNFG